MRKGLVACDPALISANVGHLIKGVNIHGTVASPVTEILLADPLSTRVTGPDDCY